MKKQRVLSWRLARIVALAVGCFVLGVLVVPANRWVSDLLWPKGATIYNYAQVTPTPNAISATPQPTDTTTPLPNDLSCNWNKLKKVIQQAQKENSYLGEMENINWTPQESNRVDFEIEHCTSQDLDQYLDKKFTTNKYQYVTAVQYDYLKNMFIFALQEEQADRIRLYRFDLVTDKSTLITEFKEKDITLGYEQQLIPLQSALNNWNQLMVFVIPSIRTPDGGSTPQKCATTLAGVWLIDLETLKRNRIRTLPSC